MGPGTWPVTLRRRYRGGELGLRPLHPRRDLQEWSALRAANRRWTGPWDSTNPYPEPALGFKAAVKEQNAEARAGRLLPWAMTWNGALAGQVHIFTIVRGAQQGGTIGYWIGERFAGHGLTPMAVAMAADHAFGVERLHRLEINVRAPTTPTRCASSKNSVGVTKACAASSSTSTARGATTARSHCCATRSTARSCSVWRISSDRAPSTLLTLSTRHSASDASTPSDPP